MSAEGFNYDNIFIRMLSRVGDAMLLSVLFVLFSLPVVTIGASLTAMYYTAMKGINGDDGYIWKYFTKSFKENFKQSTVMWIMFMLAFGVLGVDVWFWISQWTENRVEIAKPFLLVSVILLSIAVIMFIYAFPLQAKFDNGIKAQMKNSLLMGVKYFPTTLLIAAITGVVVWVFYYQTIVAIVGFVIIGFGVMGYMYSYFMLKCFKPYLPEEKVSADDLDYRVAFNDADVSDAEDEDEDDADSVDIPDAAEDKAAVSED